MNQLLKLLLTYVKPEVIRKKLVIVYYGRNRGSFIINNENYPKISTAYLLLSWPNLDHAQQFIYCSFCFFRPIILSFLPPVVSSPLPTIFCLLFFLMLILYYLLFCYPLLSLSIIIL